MDEDLSLAERARSVGAKANHTRAAIAPGGSKERLGGQSKRRPETGMDGVEERSERHIQ